VSIHTDAVTVWPIKQNMHFIRRVSFFKYDAFLTSKSLYKRETSKHVTPPHRSPNPGLATQSRDCLAAMCSSEFSRKKPTTGWASQKRTQVLAENTRCEHSRHSRWKWLACTLARV